MRDDEATVSCQEPFKSMSHTASRRPRRFVSARAREIFGSGKDLSL